MLTTHSSIIVKALEFKNLREIRINGDSKTIEEIKEMCLPYPSLNEVSYTAFGEVSEEYHNELYGYIEEKECLIRYRGGKSMRDYIKKTSNGKKNTSQVILTEYIRHQIHHPENTENSRFTHEELSQSIQAMREFISKLKK